MEKAMAERNGGSILTYAMMGAGSLVGLWVLAALTTGLMQVGWQPGELLRQYLVAVGAIGEFETLVDFYTHIKGVEYIICVAFLAAFPVFFKYVNRVEAPARAR